MSLFLLMCMKAKNLILDEKNLGKRTKKLSLDSIFSFLIKVNHSSPYLKRFTETPIQIRDETLPPMKDDHLPTPDLQIQ